MGKKPGLARALSSKLIEETRENHERMKQLAPGKNSAAGKDMIKKINYHDYLCLDQILHAQKPMTLQVSGKMAHDEMLFITIHQTYEIWFKQILHEIDSVRALMANVPVKNEDLFLVVQRLKRVVEIQKILVDQIKILETMTPLSFLEFRDHLGTSSGFQSYQFRLFEARLGLRREKRMNYGRQAYCTRLRPEQADEIRKVEEEKSLFDLVEGWLERTPMVADGDDQNNFWNHFKASVRKMFGADKTQAAEDPVLSDEERKEAYESIDHQHDTFNTIFEQDKYEQLIKSGKKRLSHKALIGALMINLYQEEGLFHLPFELLTLLVDIDQLIRTWRYRHALMVHRMLGMKIGTGGSSGYHYLKATASQHMIFNDFSDISMYLIPRQFLPALHPETKQSLGFMNDHANSPLGSKAVPGSPLNRKFSLSNLNLAE